MKKLPSNRAILAGAVLSVFINTPAFAEDIEIYVGGSAITAVAPNVLFAVDTSGSMGSTVVTQGVYNPATDYSTLPTSCVEFTNNRVYWSPGSVNTSCAGAAWFDTAYMTCAASTIATTGFYQDRLARYHNNSWSTLSVDPVLKQRNVECQSDSGVHGMTPGTFYAEDNSGDNITGGWSTSPTNEINWQLEGNYTIYSANFMNYLRSDPTAIRTRLDIVQSVVANVVNSVNGINIGLMRFSQNQEGGQISFAMQDITTGRTGFIDALNLYTPSGPTPLTEVLWEAMRYYRGDPVDYGVASAPGPSVPASQTGGNYISPIQFQCQRNSVILLTDGASNGDNGRDANLIAMPNYQNATNVTDCPHPMEHISTDGDADDGQCLDQLAAYMTNEDQLPAGLADDQTVQTYTIGFQLDMPLLNDTALQGEGLYFTADDTVGLTNAFTAIINEVLATDSTFTSPAVSVNAFSQTLNRNDLYFTLFRPEGGPHWDGNLKKYMLGFDQDVDGNTFPVIQDRNGQQAINPNTGFFQPAAQSFWSAGIDGGDVRLGGAASVLTTSRNVYTYTDSAAPSNEALTLPSNRVIETNGAITDTMLGLVVGDPFRDDLIRWARGVDIDGDYGAAGGARLQMGDPLHSQATVVQYGGTEASPDLTIFFSSNDGYLHAINENDGTELFSFIAPEILPNMFLLYENNAAFQRPYGLDGAVVSWVNDDNNDGVISGVDDHVFLYAGMRRGGSSYYAFDVTNRSAPVLKWMITNDTDDATPGNQGDFAELGQTWSTPVVRDILFDGVLTTVLVFGGGYDADQDDNLLPQDDDTGRAIYVVDADTGQRLWWAGPTGSGADLELTNMTNSIPAQVNAVDISGNGVVDRLYVGDTRAQFWRIDIDEANNGASTFASGGRVALFSEDEEEGNRRFYHAADLAVIAPIGRQPYVAIVVGSGYRAHPLNTEIEDRIYMLKDTDIFAPPATYVTIDEGDLFDATDNTIGEGNATDQEAALGNLQTAAGWFIELDVPSTGDFVGEKVLGRPLIVSGTAIVPSFIPNDPNAGGPACGPNEGIGLLYFLTVSDATPVRNYDDAGSEVDLTRSDRTVQLTRGGITPSPTLIIAQDDLGTTRAAGCAGTDCFAMPDPRVPTKTYWYEF